LGKIEHIYGKESVEDLIAMIDRNVDSVHGIIGLISATTQRTSPATYNQFIKNLKKERFSIFQKYTTKFDLENEINKDKAPLSFLSIFKSNRKEMISKLNENNLNTMITLLPNIQILELGNLKKLIKVECIQLKEKFNLQRGPANESLNRFKWAKDICIKHKSTIGTKSMQFYIDVYDTYLKEYCE